MQALRSAPLLGPASTSLQLTDSSPECYSASFAHQALGEAKGRPYKFTQAKRSILDDKKTSRLAHVHAGLPPIAGIYDLLAFPLPFEHCFFTEEHDPTLQRGFSRGLVGIKQRGLLVGTS